MLVLGSESAIQVCWQRIQRLKSETFFITIQTTSEDGLSLKKGDSRCNV